MKEGDLMGSRLDQLFKRGVPRPLQYRHAGSQSPKSYGLIVYGIPVKSTVLVSRAIKYLATVARLCTVCQLRCMEQPCSEAYSDRLWDKQPNEKHTCTSSASQPESEMLPKSCC